MSAHDFIEMTIRDGIATITLNDPATLNSLNPAMMEAFLTALTDCERGSDADAIIVTGAGRGFCSGANLTSEIVDMRDGAFEEWINEQLNPLASRIASSPLPVIAAVNGPAAGAGCSLALVCDLIVCSASAEFILSFGKIGVAMDLGASWTLMRSIGLHRARHLAMLGTALDAAMAKDWGLALEIFPDGALLEGARKIGSEMLARSTSPALAAMKRQFGFAANSTLDATLEYEAKVQAELVLTDESRTLIDSFGKG
ncbi:2-(1,2-epoxy-1,2-dihydrophenyl)acetyl-CoA isomerase [Parasphingopyxis algicola]|uniref:enoyl-CoA hydratase/isomerase family protein n=1 Tax=Parasphingopyxis algicola TaxID=2026624 RepID=UPI0015A2D13D|nr:enoyl-CoA hydratase-related protein [Parasphingopyxis algicola]QLC26456.1 2-(1,2-epoxy-1,2-dihydrophenyl)acetyl-CoA isomerase [Parasphingopyxis algicola]